MHTHNAHASQSVIHSGARAYDDIEPRQTRRTFKFAKTITFFPTKSSAAMYGTNPLKIVRGP
jgi:hypothetical protein